MTGRAEPSDPASGTAARRWRPLVLPGPIDLITLASLLLAYLALLAALQRHLSLAVGLLLCALPTDMLDGALARSTGRASALGRLLDGSVDVVVYLVAPVVVLYQAGFTSLIAVVSGYALVAAGVLRLAHFGVNGFLRDTSGTDAYPGLPVFWTLPILAIALPWLVSGRSQGAVAVALLATAALMLWDRPFWKPRAYVPLGLATLTVAGLFFAWHLRGGP